MKTIGLFGAAFDPLHLGHIAVCRLALSSGFVDEIWLLPSPPRWDKSPVADLSLRFNWAQAAAAHERKAGWQVFASDVEILMGDFKGTYRLLCELSDRDKQGNPDKQGNIFKLIIGQDSFEGLPLWRDSSTQVVNGIRIVAEYRILVVPRGQRKNTLPDWALPFASNIQFMPPISSLGDKLADLGNADSIAKLSSSEIKTRLIETRPIKNLLFSFSLREIEQEIEDLNLYG